MSRILFALLLLLPARACADSLPTPTPDDALSPLAKLALEAATTLLPVLLALLTTAAGMLVNWLRTKVKDQTAANALAGLTNAALVVVKNVSGTTVDALKAASADGSLTAADREAVKAKAVAEVKSYVGPKGMALVRDALFGGDAAATDKAVEAHVEAAVFDMRVEKAATAPVAPVVTVHTGPVVPQAVPTPILEG